MNACMVKYVDSAGLDYELKPDIVVCEHMIYIDLGLYSIGLIYISLANNFAYLIAL